MAASARLRLLRRVTGSPGAPANLLSGELAYNMVDGILYIGKGDDGGGNATSVVAVAQDGYTAMDADLTAIAALNSTGILRRTGSNTWSLDATTYQTQDADLDALAALDATAGILAKTAANTYARRTMTGTAGRLTVSQGDGLAGNPTFDLATLAVGTTVTGGSTKFTVDGYGRVTNAGQASLTDIASPTGTWSAGANLLQSSAVPAGSNDLTNKAYVDSAILAAQLAGDDKDSVRVASTGQQALSGGVAFPTIDGVTTVLGDRVLLRAQTASAENGIYVVGGTATAWTLTRAPDFNAWSLVPGAIITVEEGSTLADSIWLSVANRGGTLGTTAISFSRADSGGVTGGFTIAGAGLTSNGATVDVAPGAGISVAADTVALTGQALALHNVATAADTLIYATGAGSFSNTALTSYARTLIGAADAATARGTLGLGSMATQAANSVAITGGSITGVTIDGGTF